MKTDYLRYLQKEIHSTIFATIDSENHPVTCVIDIMLSDDKGLYFQTAKGKSFYERLKRNSFISLTGLKGKDTMSSQSITLRGKVREIGQQYLDDIFTENPYMAEIYPNEESRSALTVFQIYEGTGEFFDLSRRPIFREVFAFGDCSIIKSGFYVTDKCICCKICSKVCPQKCIIDTDCSVTIYQEHCLHCGKCQEVCPEKAIERR